MDPKPPTGRVVIGAWAAPALAFVSCTLVVVAVRVREDRDVVGRLDLVARVPLRGIGGSWLRAIGSASLVRRFTRPHRVRRLLEDAGSTRPVDEVVGERIALGAAGAILGLASPVPPLAPLLAAAAARLPEIRLRRAVAARRRRADAELPLLLDLLAAAASAGLTAQLALRAAVDATEGPLAEGFARALAAVDLGGRWRDELGRVPDRFGSPELRRAVGALTRSDALGAELSEQLTTIAADTRESRRARVTERARKAPVKMLFPLVFLVLPAFLLLTVVPVLLTTLQSIR